MNYDPTLALQRLFSRCVIEGSCFEFSGPLSRKKNGYPKIGIGGKNRSGHRVVYESHFGEIPEGMCVMHRCDNTRCLNPSHLTVGTNKDNTQDMIAKGRSTLANDKRKLSVEQVIEIKRLFADGYGYKRLSKMFCVSQCAIRCIRHGKTWIDV